MIQRLLQEQTRCSRCSRSSWRNGILAVCHLPDDVISPVTSVCERHFLTMTSYSGRRRKTGRMGIDLGKNGSFFRFDCCQNGRIGSEAVMGNGLCLSVCFPSSFHRIFVVSWTTGGTGKLIIIIGMSLLISQILDARCNPMT